MAKIQITHNTKLCQEFEATRTLIHCRKDMKSYPFHNLPYNLQPAFLKLETTQVSSMEDGIKCGIINLKKKCGIIM